MYSSLRGRFKPLLRRKTDITPHYRIRHSHIAAHCSSNIKIVDSPQDIEASSQNITPQHRHRPRNDRWAGRLVPKSLSTVRKDVMGTSCLFNQKNFGSLKASEVFLFIKIISPCPSQSPRELYPEHSRLKGVFKLQEYLASKI